ncbi:glucoamylase family protein [Sinorhizobium medicae]|uniref:glucoamylase family protein n=1 Tax=Sinorhizobium medicae TaxID=110321 RepID=UPI002AF6C438|nr:glucoamylase family protein [Sinorhizobium medicae]WQO45277.1 glucoamylase family protein [Sinorhizobium medicae]WQO65439.1 glucoamylase family protein [Sinorhizobium medicae]WQO72564.1 glucoamylase family protein [Sinorhizobium medicae]WQO91876.1 glucoamylase family protein [Sinorhizobium medicae]
MSQMLSIAPKLTRMPTDQDLGRLQFTTLLYYLHCTNPDNGLVRDKTEPNAPASIAAIGMALATLPVVVERGVMIRKFAAKIARKKLAFLLACPQGPEPDASGYKGFFYHFLDIETGRRVWQCELSTIDSAFLFAGALTVAAYFDGDSADEVEVRQLANTLYERADWSWACDHGPTLTHGWRPESGFIPYRWRGYDEGLLLYILGLGSRTHPLPPNAYSAYTESYEWRNTYGRELLYSGPLFTHQLSHMWIDFRGIRDEFMRDHNSDYFQNSRHATYVQQQYAIRNPLKFAGYGEHCWGFTASDGPGWIKRTVDGVEREFYDYTARGAPFGPDDGTVSPWVVVGSLPFAPEIVIPTVWNFAQMQLGMTRLYGFKPSFNQTFAVEGSETGWWVTPYHFGIDQGPVVLMIENYRTGLLWNVMRRCEPLVVGLRRAGFTGGWL